MFCVGYVVVLSVGKLGKEINLMIWGKGRVVRSLVYEM